MRDDTIAAEAGLGSTTGPDVDVPHADIAALAGTLTPRAAMHVFLAYVGTMVGIGLGGALFAATLLSLTGRGHPGMRGEQLKTMMGHTMGPAIVLIALLVATAVVVRLGRQYAPGPRGRREVGLVACAPSWLVGAAVLGAAIAISVGVPTFAKDFAIASVVGKIALTTALVLVAPFVEQLLFSGVMYAGFLYAFSRLGAALLAAGLFLAAHVLDTIGAPLAVLPLGLISLLAVTLRIRSGSLLPAIVLQMAYNATIVVAVLSS